MRPGNWGAPLRSCCRRPAQVHEQYTAARLAALAIDSVPASQVLQWLRLKLGPQVPRRAQVARALGVSERTLARRLAEQGQACRELALQTVADPALSLVDIGQSLGFAEASPFYRAFAAGPGCRPRAGDGSASRRPRVRSCSPPPARPTCWPSRARWGCAWHRPEARTWSPTRSGSRWG